MKTVTKKINDKEVAIEIHRLPLQPGMPYSQKIVARHGDHKLEHVVTHDPANFKAEDARRHIEGIVYQLAAKVAAMGDIADFLDDYHHESKNNSEHGPIEP